MPLDRESASGRNHSKLWYRYRAKVSVLMTNWLSGLLLWGRHSTFDRLELPLVIAVQLENAYRVDESLTSAKRTSALDSKTVSLLRAKRGGLRDTLSFVRVRLNADKYEFCEMSQNICICAIMILARCLLSHDDFELVLTSVCSLYWNFLAVSVCSGILE